MSKSKKKEIVVRHKIGKTNSPNVVLHCIKVKHSRKLSGASNQNIGD